MDPYLSDICIAATAAPTFFPAHNFHTKGRCQEKVEFNLIDAGFFANNPVIHLN
jgi:patatin-like phospholipase/acyl hydrolase